MSKIDEKLLCENCGLLGFNASGKVCAFCEKIGQIDSLRESLEQLRNLLVEARRDAAVVLGTIKPFVDDPGGIIDQIVATVRP